MAGDPFAHAEVKVNPNDLIDPAAASANPTAATGGWLNPDQERAMADYIGSKDFSPKGYADKVAAFAKQNGVVWNDDLYQRQLDLAKNIRTAPGVRGGAINYVGDPQQQQPQQPQQQDGGILSSIGDFFTGANRTEFPDVPEFQPGFGTMLGTSLAFDDAGKAGIISKMMANEQPSFTQDQFGNAMVTFGAGPNKGKQFYVNKPGISGQDVATLGTNLALTALPGGLAARGAAGAGMGALRVGVATGGGAMLGEGVRQTAGNVAGDQTRMGNTIPGVSLPDLAIAGVTEGVPAGYTFKATNLARPAGAPANIDQIIQNNAAVFDRTGVPALRGQVAGTTSELERTRVLQNLPETGAGMTDALKAQNAAVTKTTGALVEDIAPTSTKTVEAQAKEAANGAITSAKSTRAAQGGPLYDAALSGPKIDTTQLASEIKAVAEAKGAVKGTPFGDAVEKVQNIIKAGDDWQLDPRQVQSVKISISDARKAALREGRDGLANQLADVEDQIVLHLDTNAPGYKAANDTWRKLSVPVKDLQDSAIGDLANLDNFGIQQFSRKLFSGSTSSQERAFVKANLDKIDPQAYRRMVQADMGRRLDEVTDIVGDTGIANTPRLINAALFRNEATRQMWKQALPDMADRLDDLHYVLNLATTGRNAGSATATRKGIVDSLTSLFEKGGSGLRTTLLNWTIGLPVTAAEKGLGVIGTARTQQIRAGALAEQVSPDVAKMLDDYAVRLGKSNPRLGVILQSIRQYAGSDGLQSDQASQTVPDDMKSIPILQE